MKRQFESLEEQELSAGTKTDVRQPSPTRTRYGDHCRNPPVAVITGIEGGVELEERDNMGANAGRREVVEADEGLERVRCIVKTVRMEHSYM